MALAPASAATGKELTADLVRLANSAVAPLRTGIVGPEDVVPRALGQAGVGMDPGAAIIQNTYSGSVIRESYLVANDGPDDDGTIEIPAAGSGSERTDYIVWRIEDDNYAGQSSNSKANRFQRVSSLGSKAYPYMPVCKIVQPAGNTAGIQDGMVEDLREVANPLEQTAVRGRPSVADDTGQTLTAVGSPGEYFPNSAVQNLDIPIWATHMQVFAMWSAVAMPKAKNPFGRQWIEWGPNAGDGHSREHSTQKFRFNGTKLNETYRQNWIVASDSGYIPKTLRGTSQAFVFKAMYDSGSDKGVKLDGLSGTFLQVTFQMLADKSTR